MRTLFEGSDADQSRFNIKFRSCSCRYLHKIKARLSATSDARHRSRHQTTNVDSVTPTLFAFLLAGAFVSILAGVLGNWLQTPEWAKKPSRVILALAILGLAAVLIAWAARREESTPTKVVGTEPTRTTATDAVATTATKTPTAPALAPTTLAVTTPPAESARKQYIKAADAACRLRLNQASQIREQGLDELATAKAQVEVLYLMLIDWRAVVPPAVDRKFVDGLIDDYRQAVDLLYESNAYAENGDATGQAAAWNAANRISDAVQAKGRDYGFRVCTG